MVYTFAYLAGVLLGGLIVGTLLTQLFALISRKTGLDRFDLEVASVLSLAAMTLISFAGNSPATPNLVGTLLMYLVPQILVYLALVQQRRTRPPRNVSKPDPSMLLRSTIEEAENIRRRRINASTLKWAHGPSLSRITRGFHRLGLLLAIPLIVASPIPLISQFVDPSGDPVPDRSVVVEYVVTPNAKALSHGSPTGKPTVYEIDAPDDRVLEVSSPAAVDHSFLVKALGAMQAEERRLGRLFQAAEMPLSIAGVTVRYAERNRMPYYVSTHLKRGFDSTMAWTAAALFFGGLVIYALARALAWVLDGFFGPKVA